MKKRNRTTRTTSMIVEEDDVSSLVDLLTSIGVLNRSLEGNKLSLPVRGALQTTVDHLIKLAFNIAAGEELSVLASDETPS